MNAFKRHLPDSSPVNLVTERHGDGRVYVSTYPTMLNLINERDSDWQARFGVGYFDLVVIDEAHRSVFQKYKAIFEYFDSLLVGLTATPREEIDRNTYDLFDLETGVPTDAYPLAEAVGDGFLVAPRAVSVPLKFQRDGIRYDDLSEDEKDQWDEADWDEDPTASAPDEVHAEAVNKWLFNTDTVDKVLAHLLTHGEKVAGGDRLGKTIIFAKNQAHADFIYDRFNANFPGLRGEFARVITHKTEYAQDLIDKFSEEAKRFDLLLLYLELALLRSEPSFGRLQEQVRAIVGALEERGSIPMVHAELELIHDVQTDEWWQDVTLTLLERVRTRLRGLVRLIEKGKRKIVYTNFEDTIGDAGEVSLTGFMAAGFERFKRKARMYVREHRGETAIRKIHMNWPITPDDAEELKRVLRELGTDSDLDRAHTEAGGFGLFVRTLVGLDRTAAQDALARFLDQTLFNSRQVDYVAMVVQELTDNGIVDPKRFYDSPFTDLSPTGPDALFTSTEVDALIAVLREVRETAAA